MQIKIAQIIRYPIKGFQGESIYDTTIHLNKTLPGDRKFAIKYLNRKSPAGSKWLPKQFFIQSTHTDVCATLTLKWQAKILELPNGCVFERSFKGITQFASWMSLEYSDLGPFEAYSSNEALTDEPQQFISLVNLATIDFIAKATDTKNSRARYRANLYIDGLEPFAECSWTGRRIQIGTSEYRVVEQIKRCSAIECNWQGDRDLNFIEKLAGALGIEYCGIFLAVEKEGLIKTGDVLELLNGI